MEIIKSTPSLLGEHFQYQILVHIITWIILLSVVAVEQVAITVVVVVQGHIVLILVLLLLPHRMESPWVQGVHLGTTQVPVRHRGRLPYFQPSLVRVVGTGRPEPVPLVQVPAQVAVDQEIVILPERVELMEITEVPETKEEVAEEVQAPQVKVVPLPQVQTQ
jgi:hypothetical protein